MKAASSSTENALLESEQVGGGTRVWAFAHVLPGARIGADCNICDHTFIENDVVIGDRVTIRSNVQLCDGVRIEDDAFVGPNAAFTNDPAPRSKQHLDEHPVTVVRRGASIGANATILPGLTIGQYAMVGAGAVVTRSVPPYAVVVGNPARITRYDGDAGSPLAGSSTESQPQDPAIEVSGVSLHRVPRIADLRGDLIAREVGAGLPFAPRRCFLVMDVRSKEVRGEHAHRECEQLLVCAKGSMACVVDDGGPSPGGAPRRPGSRTIRAADGLDDAVQVHGRCNPGSLRVGSLRPGRLHPRLRRFLGRGPVLGIP